MFSRSDYQKHENNPENQKCEIKWVASAYPPNYEQVIHFLFYLLTIENLLHLFKNIRNFGMSNDRQISDRMTVMIAFRAMDMVMGMVLQSFKHSTVTSDYCHATTSLSMSYMSSLALQLVLELQGMQFSTL